MAMKELVIWLIGTLAALFMMYDIVVITLSKCGG